MAEPITGRPDLGIFSDIVNRAQVGSIQDEYDRRKASGEPVDYTPDKPNLRSPDPLGTGPAQQTDPSVLDAEDYVPGINFVDGTFHSAEELDKTPEGRHLIQLARDSKVGRKRGFFDAVLDANITDLPFVGMIAQVGGSIADAKNASDAIDLLESGDRDAIKSDEGQKKIWNLQTYLMDSEAKSNASFWGHVGDIVRAAPGFMGEFMASNMALGYARSAVARKLAKDGMKHLDAVTVSGVNRGTKIISREMADELVEKTATDLVGQGVSRSARAAKIGAFDAAAKETMVDKLSTSLRPFVEQTLGGQSLEGMSKLGKLAAQGAQVGVENDELVTAVTRNLAKKSIEASIAKKGSSTAIGEWARGFGQALKSEAARAAIDFGTWGTEASTMLYGSQNRWTSAVGEVLSASFLEAPIKGALMYLPKRGAQEVLNQALPGGLVTESELGLKVKAWQDDRDDLREKMWYLAEGQNLMEYVSENSGRAFGAFFRGIGLATGIAKAAPRAWVGEVGGVLREGAEKEAGGMLQRLIRKATGSPDQYVVKTEAERVAAFSRYFKNNGVDVPDQVVRTMSKLNAVPAGLTDSKALSLVGNDFADFTKRALKSAYADTKSKMEYRTFFAYTLADTMARNGWGPQQTLNALQEMGYHGVLGEMWEERYVDMANALLGIDDRQTHSLRENVDRALKAFFPERGWTQLMEEAVAFSVPLATRAAVLNVQRVLGGGSEVDRARAAGRNYKSLQTGMAVTEMGFRQFHETMQARRSELDKEVEDLTTELSIQTEAAKKAGLPENSQDVQDAKNRLDAAVKRREAQDDFIRRTLQANSIGETADDIAKAVAADGLMRFAVLPSDLERGTFADKMSTVYSSEELAEKAAAQDAILDDAAFLGRSFWRAQQYSLGDVDMNSWRRIAAKTIGIAGAIFCMEPALAQSNSIQWASVDEGADPSFVGGLGRRYGEIYKRTKARLQAEQSRYDIDDAEVDAAMKEEYEKSAKDYARNFLLLHGTRLFAHQEMVAKAIGHVAKKQGYDYDPADGMFHTEGKDAVPYTKFYEDNKAEVDKLRDDIAVSTLRLLTDDNTRLMARSGAYLSYMRMKPGDSNASKVAMALAAELSGFGHIVTEREIEAGAPLSAILAQDAETIPAQMVERVKALATKPDGTRDYGAVPDALVEEIARSFHRDVDDPSDKGLAARKKEIVDLILNAEAILPKNVMTFVKHVDVGDSNLADDPVRHVVFIKNEKTGLWQTTDTARATSDGAVLPNAKGNATWRGTEAEMLEFAKKNKLEGVNDADGNLVSGFLPSVKLTPAKVLVTSDPILLLQKLGKAQAVMEMGRDKTDATGKYKYDRVDPELRIDDETKKPVYTKAEAAKVRAEELAKARYFEGHKNVADYNFDNEEHTSENENKWRAVRDEYRKVYENVLGDRGYNTVIETVLRRLRVSTPSMSNAVNQALGLDNRRYRLPLPMWSGSENDPNVYVSIDYARNIDPTAALVTAAIHHNVIRHLRMIAPGTPMRSTLTTFWEDLDKIVLDAIYDAHTPEDVRENLRAFHDNVSSATEAPALGSLNLVISGLCLGMTDRAKEIGRNATAYDQALSYIAIRVRELGSYVGFFGMADVLLGGTGFSRLAAYRAAGAEVPRENSGILGLLSVVSDTDASSKAARDTAAFKPAGKTWSEFETEVNQYAARNFKDRPEAKGGNDVAAEDLHPIARIRRILEKNKFENEDDVHQFLRQVMRVEPVSDFAGKMAKAVRDIGARSATLENQLAAMMAEVDRLREELRTSETNGTAAAAAIQDLRDRLQKAEAEKKAAEDLLRENAAVKTEAEKLATQSALDAGNTPANVKDVEQAPAEAPKKTRKRKVFKLDQQGDKRASVDFVDNENVLVPCHLTFQDNVDGELVVDVAEDRSQVDEMTEKREARKITVNIVRHAAQAMLGHDIANTETGKAEFYDLIDMMTDSVMPRETVDTLWADFVNGVGAVSATNEDPTREEQDIEGEDDEGGGMSAESYNDGAKLAAAFDNDVLDSLLSVFSYVSTETGREFQAIVNSMRDNIVNLKDRVEAGELTSPKLAKVIDLMDALFNSRAVVAEGVDTAPDREAVFTDRLNNLLGGKANPSFDEMLRIAGGNEITIDDIVTELLASDANGNPVCRKLAFFMSYLRSLDVGARRNLMTLACSSTSCSQIGILQDDETDDRGQRHLILNTSSSRYGHVSQKAASASFMKFTRKPSAKAAEAAKAVREAASKKPDGERLSTRLRQVAKVLEPVLGRESPFVQVLTSPHLYDSLIRDTVFGAKVAVNDAASVDKYTGFVPLLDSVASILERYVEEVSALERTGKIDENRKRQLMDAIVTVEISAGLDTATAHAAHKSAGVNTAWSWVMNAYTAGLPETVARARTIPERNSRAASKVAISIRDISSVMSMFMDKDISDKNGFAYHAYEVWKTNDQADGYNDVNAERFGGKATEAEMKEYFLAKVLPACRQRMIWPDAARTEILSKNICSDYKREELREACAFHFLKRVMRPSAFNEEERKAAAKKGETVADVARNWYVPVYNGDHSSGVVMQIPTSVLGTTFGKSLAASVQEGYKSLSDRVSADWLGFEAFGQDPKRSVLSCNEFPGRSMHGVRVNADGTVTKGHSYVHVGHNYAPEMKGHNDAFLGMSLCHGYGLNVQQQTAKDQDTSTHKLQVMGASGVDLTLMKSLITMMGEYSGSDAKAKEFGRRARGAFPKGSAEAIIMDHLIKQCKAHGGEELNNEQFVDEDALKVGVLNSKNMFHPTGVMKNGKEVTQTLVKYVFSKLEDADISGTVSGTKLDELLWDGGTDENGKPDNRFAWRDWTGDRRVTIAELIGSIQPDGTRSADGIEVSVVEGLSGKFLDLTYIDDTLMSYQVANVSHKSTPQLGKMARNNAIDGLTMAAGMARAGMIEDPGLAKDYMEAIATYGIMATVVATDQSNVDAAKDNDSCMRVRKYGAHRDGVEVTEQASRDALSLLKKSLNPSFYKVAAPLLSGGAVYDDATGTVVSHTADPFIRNRQRGSRVFSWSDAKKYLTQRRLGSVRINLPLYSTNRDGEVTRTFGTRYGWFVNQELIDEVYDDVVGTEFSADGTGIDSRIAKLEQVMEAVRKSDRAHHEAYKKWSVGDMADADYERERTKALGLRLRAFRLFRDHHGVQLAQARDQKPGEALTYRLEYVQSVCLDDLFICRSDCGPKETKFDRAAVEFDVPDPAAKGAKSMYLGGSVIGLPRTPSYNGSMWAQSGRASIPCTEIEGEDGTFRPGEDAMVMPDPQTLKILGCDHDGDKADCYMLQPVMATGVCEYADPTACLPTELKTQRDAFASHAYEWVKDGAARRRYVEALVGLGLAEPPGEETIGGKTVYHGFRLSELARTTYSNSFVRGMFEMSRHLDCGVEEGDEEKDFYRTPMAKATRAHPFDITSVGENDPRWDELKRKSLDTFNFLAKSKIKVVETACKVSTSAGLADQARGQIVSLAGMLHLAQFSGCFDGEGSIFSWKGDRRENFAKWVSFMYGVDGISNATFDDIKEQICLRLGWTPGMMDSLIVDLVTSGKEPPTSAQEFFDVLDAYVTDISSHGSRFWMMVSSEASEMQDDLVDGKSARDIHLDIRKFLGAGDNGSVSKKTVRKAFGVVETNGNLDISFDQVKNEPLKAVLREMKSVVNGGYRVVGMPVDSKRPAWHYAVARLVSDVSQKRGINPGSGLLYWAARSVSKGGNARDAAARYLDWSNGVHMLQDAKTFTKSFNYTKADPASASAMSNRERQAHAFMAKMKTADTDVADVLTHLFVANMVAYNLPSKCMTNQGRAGLSAIQRETALHNWAKTLYRRPSASPLHDVVAKLFCEKTVPTYKTMQLEGNVQTHEYFAAALTSIPAVDVGDDLMSGNGGLQAWDTMEKIALAMQADSALGLPNTVAFHQGVVSMFETLYLLFSTSRQSVQFPAFSYIESVPDRRIENPSNGAQYASAKGHRRLACKYRDKDMNTQETMWAAFSDMMSGKADDAKRTTGHGFGTLAKSFNLTVENVQALLSEIAYTKDKEKWERPLRDTIRILTALGLGKGKNGTDRTDVRITPKAFFTQFLPIYATSTERTSAPSPKTRSVLNCLPGVFERLSSRQAELDSGVLGDGMMPVGSRIMDMFDATDFSLPVLAKAGSPSHIALRGATDAKSDRGTKVKVDIIQMLASLSPDDYGDVTFTGNETVEQMLEKLRGPEGTIRMNPDMTHYVGFLDGVQAFRSLHELAVERFSGTEDREPGRDAPQPVDPTEAQTDVDDGVKAMAERFQALVPWADVVYEGGGVFTVRSRGAVRGSGSAMFGKGAGTQVVIRVRVGKDGGVKADLNSPAFATSFCAAFNHSLGETRDRSGDLTPEQFLMLTKEERELLVASFTGGTGTLENGVMNYSLPLPSWSVDAKGLATLAGEIHLGDTKDDRKLYHEYFHSMIGMFRTMGIFSEQDVADLRKKFGGPAKGVNELFDEEAAANAFADWVYGRTTAEKDSGIVRIFRKLLDAVKEFLHAVFQSEYGFSYSDYDASDLLFSMVLDGYAAQSRSRLSERGVATSSEMEAEQAVSSMTFRDRLKRSVDRGVKFDRYETSDPEAAASERMEQTAVYDDPMDGYEYDEGDLPYHRALLLELDRRDPFGRRLAPRKDAVRQLALALANYRLGLEDLSPFDEFADDLRLSVDADRIRSAGADVARLQAVADDASADPETRAYAKLMIARMGQAPQESAEPAVQTASAGPQASVVPPAKTDAELQAIAASATASAEDRAKANLELKRRHPVSDENPEPSPRVSALLDEARRIIATVPDDGLAGAVAQPAAVPMAQHTVLRAAAHMAQRRMDDTDRDILSSDRFVGNVYDRAMADIAAREAATGRVAALRRAKAKNMKDMAESAAARLSRLTGTDYAVPSVLNVLMHMYEDGYVTDSAYRTNRSKSRAIMAGDGEVLTHSKRYASSSDFAGALLAASGSRFGSVVETAIKRMKALAPLAAGSEANTFVLMHAKRQLEELSAKMNVTEIMENPKAWYAALDEFSAEMFTGIRRGDYDESLKDFGPYVRTSGESETADRYQLSDPSDAGNAFRQMVLRMAADAAYTTAAQVKFCAEMGYQPGTIHEDMFTGRVVDAGEFEAVTRMFGIGQNQLTSDSPLLARWNSPTFIAANVDDWYAGSIREAFGQRNVREIFMEDSKRFRGSMAALMRQVNLVSMEWGLNRAEGRKLLAIQKYRATHTMDGHDFIKYTDKGQEVWGFSNDKGIAGAVTDVSMTDNEMRTIQLQHQLAALYLNGDDGIVTGVDGLRFTPQSFMKATLDPSTGKTFRSVETLFTEADLSPEAITKRYDDLSKKLDPKSPEAREMTTLEFALFRLTRQWHPEVTGVADVETKEAAPANSIGLYSKFAKTALRLAREAFDRYGDDLSGLRGVKGASVDEAFNDIILRGLEAEGLVRATAGNERVRDANGMPLLTEATMFIRGADIERMFESSSAYEKLVSAGRDKSRLSARHLADEFGKTVVEFKKAAREMPWITAGDAKYLNKLDTMIPVFEGTGVFMRNAIRMERDTKHQQMVRIARHEATWSNMLSDPAAQDKTYRDLTDMQLRMVHDYFNTDEEGLALMDAMERGDYAEGKRKSQRTGLVVNNGSEKDLRGTMFTDVVTQIYRRQLERRISMLEGSRPADFETEDQIARMLQAYEHSAETGIATDKGMGLNASQLYRMYGVLPANFTIGHALVTTMRGIQNSLYFRSTLTSMLMTPDIDGNPLYFAKPSLHNWEAAGIPDAVWGEVARWWASRLGPSVAYDIEQTGIENARRIYDLVADTRAKSSSKKDVDFAGTKRRYADLSRDEMEKSESMEAFMCQVANSDDAEANALNRAFTAKNIFSLDGSEALGYARHLFQVSRLPPNAVCSALHRITSWSKSMSVAFSFFFPIATKWESPTAAVGALATLGSNLSPETMRKHAADLAKIQGAFAKLPGLYGKAFGAKDSAANAKDSALAGGASEGWLDENFLGFQDIRRMMDTNDPFLADLVMWAEAIGISMTDRLVNPMEPGKAAVVEDIQTMTGVVKKVFGKQAAANFDAVMDAVFLRQGEKAFTYALNATKLAVASQVALKLKHQAELEGKAFDPIRDMKGIAEYVDSEVGGVNAYRYAWAHPHMQRLLNLMWFSWQWTRTAWEAGGGGILEDILFGGHTISKQQKKATPGRWLRMYGEVILGVPFAIQLFGKLLACLPFVDDDDDDKWFTWQNDSKVGATSANITPYLRFMRSFDDAIGSPLRAVKNNALATAGVTSLLGAAAGYRKGGISGAVLGAATAFGAGGAAANLIPLYHSRYNMSANQNEQFFANIGKQGLEFVRWFDNFTGQAVSKQALFPQALEVAMLGYNPSAPDIPVPRWAGFVNMFMPFSASGVWQYGPAGAIALGMSVKKGSSKRAIIDRVERRMAQIAENDRSLYSLGTKNREGKRGALLAKRLADIKHDARMAGIVDFDTDVVGPAGQAVVGKYTQELFDAQPKTTEADFDVRKAEAAMRKLKRLGSSFEGVAKAIHDKYKAKGHEFGTDPRNAKFERRIDRILEATYYNAGGVDGAELDNQFREKTRRDY